MLMVIYPSWPHRLTAFLITKKVFLSKEEEKKVLEENKTYDCSKETLFCCEIKIGGVEWRIFFFLSIYSQTQMVGWLTNIIYI
jgi:hypothetical protein